ncbi:MAG: bifunctional proline dehydrogenase/L-glutamate gamma-semialdehyde dehydrogenase PutA [Rhodobacteraceae bacterium]|nr:bifunctional proline dehydrogenase/L-glutamate gamma-semialdehyde dehydrogenase PutA [Paracoccaceae bacterium]
MTNLADIRQTIRSFNLKPETQVLQELQVNSGISDRLRKSGKARAVGLVNAIRSDSSPALMEVFLAEYGLSTDEGVALMCLAEALLRVPDSETIDALIEDKIAPSAWGEHLGHSSSSLVNASTWGLMLTGKVLQESETRGIAGVLRGAIKRLGEPVIRVAVDRAIKEMGHQFVLGRTIKEAVKRGADQQKQGYTFSYDMLGEAALTRKDAAKFYAAYADSIKKLEPSCISDDIRENPGISVKLSALHPRYEMGQKARVMGELTARVLKLAKMAKDAGMGFNIDAEEADRLDLSLDVIEAVMRDPSLAGWDGFGVVVQAYGKRAAHVLDWLYALAQELDRRIMVRLVKGAYWDTEIKRAQVEGLAGFPVFTRKVATDVSYLCCAEKLLAMTDRIYPQFATHNAHTVAMIVDMANDFSAFEFQRLHGMGETLHDLVLKGEGTRCRIYAPVGAHRDLLAYLVRRLLENGANSSFVNQIVDESVPADLVAQDPFEELADLGSDLPDAVLMPAHIFGKERQNSKGWDLHDVPDLEAIEAARGKFLKCEWTASPLMAKKARGIELQNVRNPANNKDQVGQVVLADEDDVETALASAIDWTSSSASDRADVLRTAANLYEENFGELFAVLSREAGKTPNDAIGELREAVDFLRFYADEAERLGDAPARGLFACISPWNFPLAIFTGQIAAALAAGNGVLAKPAESTALTAFCAVELLHEAGVPDTVLQLLPGHGSVVGAKLSGDPRISGVCFTGSTATAQRINRAMAANLDPAAPLIAETGGLNAMVVDSTALPEQAIRDIITGAFQSAGQRCSALRVLYLQEDIAEPFLEMLYGAMDEQVIGNPWEFSTDIGPVIDDVAKSKIVTHVEAARSEGRVLKEVKAPMVGTFVSPTVLKVNGIGDLAEEIFGPVLHVATFAADKLDGVIDAVNETGFGLTFGMHSRIDSRVQDITSKLKAGNIYVNRNQIGAIVGSQPFGGEGLSGTGPKAGGPSYVERFKKSETRQNGVANGSAADAAALQVALIAAGNRPSVSLGTESLPGPTGESNQLTRFGRGTVLCLGPSAEDVAVQEQAAYLAGCAPVTPEGCLEREALARLEEFDAVLLWSEAADQQSARQALASRDGAIIPLICDANPGPRLHLERHICVDTTAAGGNAALLADAG